MHNSNMSNRCASSTKGCALIIEKFTPAYTFSDPRRLLTGFGYVACVAIGNRYDRNKTPSTACEYWGDRVMLLVKVLICVIYRPIKAQPVHGDGQKIVT